MEENYESDENVETVMEVDSYEDNDELYNNYDNPSEISPHYDISQYTINDESLIIVEENEISSSDISDDEMLPVRKNIYKPHSITEQKKIVCSKIKDNIDFEMFDQQVPIKKKNASAVLINSPQKKNLLRKPSDYLNLDKIAIPKSDNSTVKFTVPTIVSVSSQAIKSPSISIVSTSSITKPSTKTSLNNTFTRLKPPFSINEMGYNKNTSKMTKDYNLASSVDSTSEVYVVPPNSMNFMLPKISKVESKKPSLKSNSSVSSIAKKNNPVAKSVRQKKNSYMTPKFTQNNLQKKESKFIAHMQELSDGKYKMVPAQGKVPHDLENLFKRNSHFVKQNISLNSIENQHKQKKTITRKNAAINSGLPSWNKKMVPHTATSSDTMENNLPTITGYGSLKDFNAIEITEGASLLSSMIKNFSEDSNSSINSIVDDDVIELFPSDDCVSKDTTNDDNVHEKHFQNKSEENNDAKYNRSDKEDDNESGEFISCHYEYCDTLVHEPELIDGLYCSLSCKNSNSKPAAPEIQSINEIKETKTTPKKPIIDRKQLLAKIGNRIHKRKQQLTSCPKKKARNDNWDELQFEENCFSEQLVKEPSPINSVHDNNIQVIDDEDWDSSFDLETFKGDPNTMHYLENLVINAAPKHLFDKPFPSEKNFFEVGHKLEGIDPEHETLFCVMTVKEVCGYRIKLHFDGYAEEYCFWVNADCPDLFYATWCEQNGRTVQPPKDYNKKFNWNIYLAECQAMAAPKCCFSSIKNLAKCVDHQFRIGDKLEALDILTRILPKQLICVATVSDIIGNRICIHFDGWTDDFNYWTDITSTNIHPVRWCENNGRGLAPPSGYNDFKGKRPFTWTRYLKETNSTPVPESAFSRRPLRDFTIDMTIEVVDLVVPSLIRVAKIVDLKGDELKILYDGFDPMYAIWVEDDSPDIHPIGWALKTKHPIEIPPGKNSLWSCGIAGCNGKGNASNSSPNHILVEECPYEEDAWKRTVVGISKLPDRLKITDAMVYAHINRPPSSKSQSSTLHQDDEKKGKSKLNTAVSNNSLKQKGKNIHNKTSNDQLSIESKRSIDTKNSTKFHTTSDYMGLRQDIGLSVISHDLSSLSMAKRGRAWTRHNAQLGIPLFKTTDVRKWSVKEVASYVEQVVSTKYADHNINEQINVSDRFVDQEIDGEAFLMLSQDELMKLLKIPLGPAIKLSSAIIMLRQRVPAFD